jgi:hypothetical protein
MLTLTVFTSMLSRYTLNNNNKYLLTLRTINVSRYLLLLSKVYLDNIEVRTVNVNRYLLLLFKVYLDNIEVRTVNDIDFSYLYDI